MKKLVYVLFTLLWVSLYAPRHEDALRLLEGKTNIIPVAIIGSGPAGLTAAIPPVRAGYHTVIFTGPKFGGELMDAQVVENWPGSSKASGTECMQNLETQVTNLGAHIAHLTVTSIDLSLWPFRLTLSDGTAANALTLILATGASQKKLGIEGEELYWGKGLFSCGICDASFTRHKDTVVLGDGNIAIQRVLQLAPVAKSITLIVPGSRLTADETMLKRLIGLQNIQPPLFNKEIKSIAGNGITISHVELIDTQTGQSSICKTSSIFLSAAMSPNTELVSGKLPLDSFGCIELKNGTQETSIEGVLAAGTVANYHYRQVPVIMGEATKAGMDALRILSQWGLDGAMRKLIQQNLYIPASGTSRVEELKEASDFEKKLTSPSLLAEFYSPNCSACRSMDAPVNRIAEKLKEKLEVIKISKEKFTQLFENCAIKMIPTFILFSQGREMNRNEGVTSEDIIKQFLADQGFES